MPIKSRDSLIGARAFFIGIVLAVLVGISSGIGLFTSNISNQLILGILAVLGLIVGYFVAERDVHTFLFASVSLVLVSFAGIQGMVLDAAIRGIAIGKMISSILGALLFLFVPSTICNAFASRMARSTGNS